MSNFCLICLSGSAIKGILGVSKAICRRRKVFQREKSVQTQTPVDFSRHNRTSEINLLLHSRIKCFGPQETSTTAGIKHLKGFLDSGRGPARSLLQQMRSLSTQLTTPRSITRSGITTPKSRNAICPKERWGFLLGRVSLRFVVTASSYQDTYPGSTALRQNSALIHVPTGQTTTTTKTFNPFISDPKHFRRSYNTKTHNSVRVNAAWEKYMRW